jgi:hypothetical protein
MDGLGVAAIMSLMGAIPLLRTQVTGLGIRLELGTWCYGNGRTLPEAADDLVARLSSHATALRAGGMRFHSEMPMPDPALLDFLWELGDVAGKPEQVRARIFGDEDAAPA